MNTELGKIYKTNNDTITLINPYTINELILRNVCKTLVFFFLCGSFASIYEPNFGIVFSIGFCVIAFILLIGLFVIKNKKIVFNLKNEEIVSDFVSFTEDDLCKVLFFSNVECIYVTEKSLPKTETNKETDECFLSGNIREINIITQIQDTPITLLSLDKSELLENDYYSIRDLNEIAKSLSEILDCDYIEGKNDIETIFVDDEPIERKLISKNTVSNKKSQYINTTLMIIIPIITISIISIYKPLKAIIKSMNSNVSLSSTQIDKDKTLDTIKQMIDEKNYKANLIQEQPTD